MGPSVCWAEAHCGAERAPGLAGWGSTHCPRDSGPMGEEHGAPVCFIIPPPETSPGAALWGSFLRLRVGCPIRSSLNRGALTHFPYRQEQKKG